jgi:hypothetical protein
MASQQITEESVYLCTGNPMPKDIEQIAFWLLNEPFSTSFKCILSYQSPLTSNETWILQPIAYRILGYVSDMGTCWIRLGYVSVEYPEKNKCR